jgi:hypothetical protein
MDLAIVCNHAMLLKADVTEEEAFATIRKFLSINQYPIDSVRVTNQEMFAHKRKRVFVTGRFSRGETFPSLRFEFLEEDDPCTVYSLHERSDWEGNPYSIRDANNKYVLKMIINYFETCSREEGGQ